MKQNRGLAAERRRLPRTVWLLSWVSLLADISGEMMYPLLPLFLVSVLGVGQIEVGLIEGLALLMVALMSAYAGWRSDRRTLTGGGRVPWIRWGYGLPVVGKGLIAVALGWPLVLTGRLLDRLGKGLRGAPRDALIADAVDESQRGQAFGLHRALDTAGALLGVLLSAFLLWWWSGSPSATAGLETPPASPLPSAEAYRAVFAVSALLGFGSLVLTFLLREPSASAEGLQSATDTSGTAEFPEELVQPEPSRPFWNALPQRYWYVLGVLTLFGLANSSDAFLLLRAQELGFSPWAVVLAYALFNVTYAAASYPAGNVSDRFGRWRVIAAGWVIYLVVYLAFASLGPTNAWAVWPLLALYGVYMALTEGVGKALIADAAPPRLRGRAMGLFHATNGIATLLASLLAGVIWESAGASWALVCSGAISGLALSQLWLWRSHVVPPERSR